jgi:hypothetical protein
LTVEERAELADALDEQPERHAPVVRHAAGAALAEALRVGAVLRVACLLAERAFRVLGEGALDAHEPERREPRGGILLAVVPQRHERVIVPQPFDRAVVRHEGAPGEPCEPSGGGVDAARTRVGAADERAQRSDLPVAELGVPAALVLGQLAQERPPLEPRPHRVARTRLEVGQELRLGRTPRASVAGW